jgi:ADP-ribosylglycohydrolase
MTRALTTLLSLAAADALGAATEFKSPERIQTQYGGTLTDYQPGSVFGFAPGEATDDSQMAVATLLGYARREGLGGVLSALRGWLAAGPPDAGGLTRSALGWGTLDGGVWAWQTSGYDSAGNGGLMRIAAVWIAGFRGPELARQSACVTALTHADPRCVYASVFLTAWLEALEGGQAYGAAADAALRLTGDFDARAVLLDAGIFGVDTREAHTAFRDRERGARAEVRARVRAGLGGHLTSQSGYVLDTLEAAVRHAGADSWMDCVQPAVLMGDDSDTVACVVGAVAWARGLEAPPHLLPALRLGHSWPGWQRAWPCTEHLAGVVAGAQRP